MFPVSLRVCGTVTESIPVHNILLESRDPLRAVLKDNMKQQVFLLFWEHKHGKTCQKHVQTLYRHSGRQLWGRKTENETAFPLRGVETHTRLWLLSFCSTAAKKTCFSHTALSLLPRVLASKDTGLHQNWRAYARLS